MKRGLFACRDPQTGHGNGGTDCEQENCGTDHGDSSNQSG